MVARGSESCRNMNSTNQTHQMQKCAKFTQVSRNLKKNLLKSKSQTIRCFKYGWFTSANKIDNKFAVVPKAMAFLARYGIYMCTSTDKFVGRMLDIHARQHHVSGHPLIGLFNANLNKTNENHCRVRKFANTIRIAIRALNKKKKDRQFWKLSQKVKRGVTAE